MNLPLWAALLEASTGPRSKDRGDLSIVLLLLENYDALQRGRDPKTAETGNRHLVQ